MNSKVDELRKYLNGEIRICAWIGVNSGILRIEGPADTMAYGECYKSYLPHHMNSLHISNLRIATPHEIEMLGNKQWMPINLNKNYRRLLSKV